MTRVWEVFRTGAVFALLEHARHRLATVLVVVYIPLRLTLEHWFVSPVPARFLLRATGRTVTVDGNHLTMASGAVNTVTPSGRRPSSYGPATISARPPHSRRPSAPHEPPRPTCSGPGSGRTPS
ncbi:hypothetical protein [Streptomyces sp. NPDC059994]|uniref:hypothetical protein n=1 Tax=Streptomyces sp. NPDC059994 TaxID=3347029 RepID=UPI0036880126